MVDVFLLWEDEAVVLIFDMVEAQLALDCS